MTYVTRRSALKGMAAVSLGLAAGVLDVVRVAPAVAATSGSTLRITGAKQIGGGGMPSARVAGKPIVYGAWDANKIYRLHTVNPDGSNDQQLTTNPGHACGPEWHPSGEWIVYTSEIPNNALQFIHSDGPLSEWFVNGLWMNLCAYHVPDGKLYTLMSYSLKTDGAMGPKFSPDGGKLAWSRIVGNPDGAHKYGYYRLMVADWTVSNGVPSVQNARDITPPDMAFVEVTAVSNDALLFSSDTGTGNLWICGVDGSNPVNLTPNAQYWHEHASFTPAGDIVYMGPASGEIGRTELSVMRQPLTPSSGAYQLTHFGVAGSPEYISDWCFTPGASFVAGTSKLAVEVQMVWGYPERRLWVLDYQTV